MLAFVLPPLSSTTAHTPQEKPYLRKSVGLPGAMKYECIVRFIYAR
jgi:hypothetical protein